MSRVLPLAAVVAGLLAVSSVQADVTTTGDISPATDPLTWDDINTNAIVANTADGAMEITGGSTVTTRTLHVGNSLGPKGVVTVNGSTLNNARDLDVGFGGVGLLNVINGAQVTTTNAAQGALIVGYGTYGVGTVNVSGSTMNVGVARIGSSGEGTLNISDGAIVNSSKNSYISYQAATGKTSYANVDGLGSAWNITGSGTNPSLTVGQIGSGNLRITNGGQVNLSTFGLVARNSSISTATVDGVGSQWNMNQGLRLGYFDDSKARVSISDGGAINAASVDSKAASILTVDAGKGSLLNVGSGAGTITNSGVIRLVAGAGADSGSYTPLQYGTLAGTGTVQALGGVWDADAHTVTVSDAVTAQAGETATFDLSTTQRLLVTDGATGDSVGLGFKGSDASTSLSFSASPAEAAQQAALQSLLAEGQGILSAWDFTPGAGYTSGDPVYLSLGIGSGYKLTDLAIWHFDDGLWSLFSASDLAYDNLYASFTATGFSSYAVTAPVPVPAAVWLFGSALAGLLGFVHRKGRVAA